MQGEGPKSSRCRKNSRWGQNRRLNISRKSFSITIANMKYGRNLCRPRILKAPLLPALSREFSVMSVAFGWISGTAEHRVQSGRGQAILRRCDGRLCWVRRGPGESDQSAAADLVTPLCSLLLFGHQQPQPTCRISGGQCIITGHHGRVVGVLDRIVREKHLPLLPDIRSFFAAIYRRWRVADCQGIPLLGCHAPAADRRRSPKKLLAMACS